MKLRKQKPEPSERRRPVTTSQPGVFSYYSQRSNAPDLKLQLSRNAAEVPKKSWVTRLQIGLIPSYIALVVVLGAVVYSLWLEPVPRVKVVSQTGTVYRTSEQYQKQIETIWRQSLLNQSKLTVNSGKLKQDMLQQFGEIADVRIDLPLLGRRPAITLTPEPPAFELVSGNGIYYVNRNGRVMTLTKDVTKNELADLPLVRDETGLQTEVGKVILPGTEAEYLAKLFAQLHDAGVKVQSITLPGNAAKEADVRLTDQSYYIKFLIEGDPRQAVGSYLAIRDKLQADSITPKQYIDVRVEEKVFYQ